MKRCLALPIVRLGEVGSQTILPKGPNRNTVPSYYLDRKRDAKARNGYRRGSGLPKRYRKVTFALIDPDASAFDLSETIATPCGELHPCPVVVYCVPSFARDYARAVFSAYCLSAVLQDAPLYLE